MSAPVLAWSQAWRVECDEVGRCVLSAGADRQLEILGLEPETVTALLDWTERYAQPASAAQERLADRLVDIGALTTPLPHRVRVLGAGPFADSMVDVLTTRVKVTDESPDVTVVVRSHAGWPELPAGPHVAVDAVFHHTIVLGPFVIPGRTACTWCLDTRRDRRWGIVPPSPVPAAQDCGAVVGELTAIQLGLIRTGVSPLINATIAWDLERGFTDRQTLLKLPDCPNCRGSAATGRVRLPVRANP